MQTGLQEALSHRQFLTESLIPDLLEKLEKEGSEALKEADAHKALITKTLKVILTCCLYISLNMKATN